MSEPVTRRELAAAARARAAAASGVAALAFAGGAGAGADAAVLTPEEADGQVLSLVLSLEFVSALAYRRVVDSGLLTPRTGRVVAEFLTQEHEHVEVIRSELRRLGTPAPAPPSSLAYAQSQLAARNGWGSFTNLHTEKDCLGLLTGAEAVTQGVYYQALGKLSHPTLLRTAAQILAAEAQHATIIEGVLHAGDARKSVPSSFVEGIS